MFDVTVVGVVLLAAGGSARMGRSKQLLPYRGTTLLRHAATVAAEAKLRPAVVVLGAEADRAAAELIGLPVLPVVNAEWARGLGTSIHVGVTAALAAEPNLSAVVLTLADLPLVTPDLLRQLARSHVETGRQLAACRYADAPGVPALFGRAFFPVLQALPDDQGAKKLLRAAGAEVTLIDFPGGAADIDTPAEYERLLGQPSADPRNE